MKILSSSKIYFVPVMNIVAVCLIFAIPVWYGSWYPNAQEYLHHANVLNASNANFDFTQAKPDFLDVLLENWSDYKSPPFYALITLVLAVFTQAKNFTISKELSDLKTSQALLEDKSRDLHVKINDEQESHSDTRQLYYDSLKSHLRKFCEATDGYNPEKCRASIYRIDGDANLGRLIFRCSGISKYENKGRVSIPLGEGVVGATAQNGESVYISISNRRYAASMKKALSSHGVSISDATLSTIQMKSNTYYGRAVRNLLSGEKIAVLIIESLDERAFDKDILNPFFERNNNDFTRWVEHIAKIDVVLNPYGGKP